VSPSPFDESTAVLAIDLQNGIFAAGEHQVHDASGVLERAAAILNAARLAGVPALYCQDDAGPGLWAPDAAAWKIHERVSPGDSAFIFRKQFGDAFRATPLDEELQRLGRSHVIVLGAMTDFSVRATLQRALLRGYRVTLVEDAHSTLDAFDAPAPEHVRLLNAEVRAAARRGLPLQLEPAAVLVD
jgi:nicotinamidase-related amidase